MDAIEVRGVRAHGRHGANPGERDAAQPFDIDVTLDVDLSRARTSDDLADTLDYDALVRSVRSIVRTTSFRLLERLGDALLTAIMQDVRVAGASVRIAKPRLLDGATPAVIVRARRSSA